jgi:periplasmic protein TonB
MKKNILLAAFIIVATSTFCQSTPIIRKDSLSEVKDTSIHKEKQDEKPIYGIEQMPQFPGGEVELLNFVRRNLHYPSSAAKVGIQGRVVIRFVVNTDGDVVDIKVIRSLDPNCDDEAVRVVKMMPKWIPGRKNGQKVAVYYTMPFVFKLQK